MTNKYDGFVKYDKLIRDRIPEIIAATGTRYKTHIAGDEEYNEKLIAKLMEEVKEFLEEPCAKELADILEVVKAIAELDFGGMEEVERVRRERAENRGSFKKRIILEETDNR